MTFTLLLEDEDLQIKLVTDLLKHKLNMPVKATKYIDEALVIAEDNPVLIISDIVLVKPTLHSTQFNNDGLKFAKAIKENSDTKHIPFILRSTLPLKDFNVTLEDTKADTFITKDSGIDELVRVVKSYISH